MSNQDRKAKAQAAASSTGKGANAVIVGGVVVIVAIVLVVGGVVFNAIRDGGGSRVNELPQGVAKGEPIEPYADAGAPKDAPVVDVYEDFRCPACKVFEKYAGETITELAQDGKIELRVHLKTVIDSMTGGESSAVAGSSAICALDQGAWTEYHAALFEMQPESETREGYSEDTYTEAAKQAGLEGEALEEWQQCTDDETYVQYVQGVDDATTKAGITGTPTVEVNGTTFNWSSVIDQETGEVDHELLKDVLTSGEVPQEMVARQ